MGIIIDYIDNCARDILDRIDELNSVRDKKSRKYLDEFKKLDTETQLEIIKNVIWQQENSILNAIDNEKEIGLISLGSIRLNKIKIYIKERAKELSKKDLSKEERFEVLKKEIKQKLFKEKKEKLVLKNLHNRT